MNNELGIDIRTARRVVDEFPDVEVVHDLEWFSDAERWGMCIEVTIDKNDARELPERTRWWVVIDRNYP